MSVDCVGERRLVAPASVAVLLCLLALVAPSSAWAASPSTLTLSPSPALVGETVRLSGTVPGSVARAVQVQRRVGSSWRVAARLRSDALGAYAWSVRATTRQGYRVVAPAVRVGSRRLASSTSATRTLAVTSGHASLGLDTRPGFAFATVTADFAPVRPGRPATLQARLAGTWVDVRSGQLDEVGRVRWQWVPPTTAPVVVRVVVGAWQGAAASPGPVGTVDVPEPVVTTPTPTPTPAPAPPDPGPLLPAGSTLMSRLPDGGAMASAYAATLSADGSRVAFAGTLPDRTGAGAQTWSQVWLRDVAAGTLRQVSVAPDGASARAHSIAPHLSADGAHLVFVTGDPAITGTGDWSNQLVHHDVASGATTRLSQPRMAGYDVTEVTDASLSADGRRTAFVAGVMLTPTLHARRLLVHDAATGATTEVPVPTELWDPGSVSDPKLSGDGSHVVYLGRHPGPDGSRSRTDVYRTDLATGSVDVVSATAGGVRADGDSSSPSISDDGQRVGFASVASTLGAPARTLRFYLRDLAADRLTVLPWTEEASWLDLPQEATALSGDGTTMAVVSPTTTPTASGGRSRTLLVHDLARGAVRTAVSAEDQDLTSFGRVRLSRDGSAAVYADRGQVVRRSPLLPTP